MPEDSTEKVDTENFRFSFMLSVLDQLSDGLYSNIAAILTEAVANAWDADARTVEITLDLANDQIVVLDDGHGMSSEDVQTRYLYVGYMRRADGGDKSPGGRPVMGRKGIGKLSLFTVADELAVETKKKDDEPLGFCIDIADLRKRARQQEKVEYFSIPRCSPEHSDDLGQHGTRVELRKLRKDRLRATDPRTLRRMLARRFSILGSEQFRVVVNGEEVTAEDREDLKFAEYLWTFGDEQPTLPKDVKPKKVFNLPMRAEGWPADWHIAGWVASVDKPRSLSTPEGNLNSIVVHARGRLAAEDILSDVQGAQHFYRYVTGQVTADFLDTTDREDVITSDRQRLRDYDDRVGKLRAFLKTQLETMESTWKDLRSEERKKGLFDQFPQLRTWLDGLQKGFKEKAETLLEKVAAMEDGDGRPMADRELMRATLFGFERLMLRGDAEKLERAMEDGPDAMLKLLAGQDELEMALYRDIVIERLRAIEALSKLTEENQKERVLQEYLFDHLWMLDPAWDRATGNAEMEKRLKLQSCFSDDNETKEKFGRIDIRYRQVGGGNVLVELKRYKVKPSPFQLAEQCSQYVQALKQVESTPKTWSIVAIVGTMSADDREKAEYHMRAEARDARVVTYDQLISQAASQYSEFIERTRKADRIARLFDVSVDGKD